MQWWSICPDNAVEFSESWALAHTPPADRIDRVVLRQDSIRYIEEASDAFCGMPKKYDFASKVWCGSSKPRKMRAPARPFVVGYVDGRPADVRASFYAATYREVVRAWRERIMVCCEGDLVREDGVLTLKNTRYFRLLQEADGN
jgi:hypothetical protein